MGKHGMTTAEWLAAARDHGASGRILGALYSDRPTMARKRALLLELLRTYDGRFGDGPVVVSRAPGRLNIMGRHIDHQGGHVNMIALDRDTWVVMGRARTRGRVRDGLVRLVNLDNSRFGEREFRLEELLPSYAGQPWREYVDEPAMASRTASLAGDWSLYVQAAVARFRARFPDALPGGLTLAAGGDVPAAAGLSSSSALVVATMEALFGLTGLEIPDTEFVELCGEAEWYVGTRGGSGDHAAMKMARRGKVVQMRFFPLEVTDVVDFPEGHVMVVCNSGVSARKSAGAKDTFNQRVACYHLGRELFKRANPELAGRITHLRDMLPAALGAADEEILRRFEALPESASRAELEAHLPAETAGPLFGGHSEEAGPYRIRGVMAFGLAECERGRRTAELLGSGRFAEFGKSMNISQQGERVADSWNPTGPLGEIPGSYGCSIPEIDRMWEIANSVEGVLGAQISGAGLGGCLMVLAREEAVEALRESLSREYYGPAGVRGEVFACYPSAGSGVVDRE